MSRVHKPSSGQEDYAYINTRIKAMRVDLLSKDDYERMMEQKDIIALLDYLKATCYGRDITQYEGKVTKELSPLKTIEVATEKNLINIVQKVGRFTDGDPKILFHLLISKYDLDNVKVVIRGVHAKLGYEEIIENLLPIGTYKEGYFQELAKQKDLGAVVALMKKSVSPFSKALESAYEQFQRTGKLLLLELALDKAYYGALLKEFSGGEETKGLIYNMFRREIDILNAMTVLRLVREKPQNIKALELYVNSGVKISRSAFESISTSNSIDEALKALGELGYRDEIESRMALYIKTRDISVFERAFQESLERYIKKAFRYDCLGIGIILSYLKSKLSEVVNVRIIARSVDFGMPEEIIKGELIVV